ncbi:MAG: hypothetical protein QF628_04325 [Acidimicrobiales bacterium]|nr:hypothetical protein [Acidimicrobiales bacterium]
MARKRPSGDLLDLLRRYLRQQTVDPLRSVGRFLLFGISGTLFIGVGIVLLAVGGLRLLQGAEILGGSWSWVPYLLVAAGLGCVVVLSFTRIGGGRGLDS